MLKLILGVIAGFIVWSAFWLGSDFFLQSISPTWFGAQKDAMALALTNGESFHPDTTVLLLDLVRSGVASIMAGFIAAMIAGENRRAPLVLGVILLLVGMFVQYHVWNLMPVWYHFLFLFLLIPLAMLGGKMKQSG